MNSREVKIVWNDTAVFSPKNKVISISKMYTIGILEKEYDSHLLIKNPITRRLADNAPHPDGKRPVFYLIPKGMIESIEDYKKISRHILSRPSRLL